MILERRHLIDAEHGIDAQTIRKKVTDIMEMVRARAGTDDAPSARGRRGSRSRAPSAVFDLAGVAPDELDRLIRTLEEEMHEASAELKFEYAAKLRDEIKELRRELQALAGA